ncbi:hypothetical protein ONZ45_g2511 [Pleurotus djamor]|nr:hypothetical protein ONZ45_g2511 [Pleurotus djamor]
MRKRQRTLDAANPADPSQQQLQQQSQPVTEDAFIADNDAVDSGAEDDDDDPDKPKSDKKAGRRKIKIEFIQDKSRRHITFSKRKAGIMKKAYELSTLTGTQVLLLVVSETGLVYTFTTAKLQPLVTQPEGKNLIQACLNAPQGSLPSSMPIGPPLGRAQPMNTSNSSSNNLPGGLSINSSQGGAPVKEDDDQDEEEVRAGPKRRRRASTTSAATGANSSPPPPPQSVQGGTAGANQLNLTGSPTSPQQAHSQLQGTNSPSSFSPAATYAQPGQHHTDPGSAMYGSPHMMGQPAHSYYTGGPGQAPAQQQLGGMPQQQQHGHWAQPAQQQQQVQGGHYGRR